MSYFFIIIAACALIYSLIYTVRVIDNFNRSYKHFIKHIVIGFLVFALSMIGFVFTAVEADIPESNIIEEEPYYYETD